MSKKSFYYTMLAGLSTAWAGLLFYRCRKEHARNRISVSIDKDKEGIWRILDKYNQNKGTLVVMRGDTVDWLTNKSDVEFEFPQGVSEYFKTEPAFFKNDHVQKITKGNDLQLAIKRTAPLGKITYKVRLVDTGEEVVGHSPPVMIIRR